MSVDKDVASDRTCLSCKSVNKAGWEKPCYYCNGASEFSKTFATPSVGEHSTSHNNGGKTDYYDLPSDVNQCQDIIEWRSMNFAQGNIFKSAFCFNTDRHMGTNYERELNKIIYFVKRELERIKENEKGD